jgi:hypothetical protein
MVNGAAGQPAVAVVPAGHVEAVRRDARFDVPRAPPSAHAEGAEELRLVLPRDLDGVVRCGRADPGTLRARLVARGAAVHDHALSVEAQLEGEDVAVAVARQVVGTERAGVHEQRVAAFAPDVVAGLRKRSGGEIGRVEAEPSGVFQDRAGSGSDVERSVVEEGDLAVGVAHRRHEPQDRRQALFEADARLVPLGENVDEVEQSMDEPQLVHRRALDVPAVEKELLAQLLLEHAVGAPLPAFGARAAQAGRHELQRNRALEQVIAAQVVLERVAEACGLCLDRSQEPRPFSR